MEIGFESITQWEGYVTAKQDEFREVLFSLISDSEGHRKTVESLLDLVRATDESSYTPIKPREIIFRGNNDLEMMTQISKMEILMYNLYSDIKKAFIASETELLLNDESDEESFLSAMDALIRDEAKHMEMVSQYVRNVERLR